MEQKRGFFTDISNGSEKFSFGKYFGKSIRRILQTKPKYIIWVKDNTNYYFSQAIEKEIKRLNVI